MLLSITHGIVQHMEDDVFWRADGSSFPVNYTSSPIVDGDQLRGAVLTFNDVTERKRFEAQLQYLADHDPITGLYNRRRFEQELARHLSYDARYGSGGAVLALDIDNFKYINDTLGHKAGDEVITRVARSHPRADPRDRHVRAPGRRRVRAPPARGRHRAGAVRGAHDHRRRPRPRGLGRPASRSG